MDAVVKIFLIPCLFVLVASDQCYHYLYGYSYCSGYCAGYYGYEYCDYWYDYATVGSLSVGAFIGIIIGSLIFLGILATVIVLACCACTKSSGQTGRVIYPANSQTTSSIHTRETNFYPAMPSAPQYTETSFGGSYPQQLSAPPTQAGYGGVPPPSYSSLGTPNSNTVYNHLPQNNNTQNS